MITLELDPNLVKPGWTALIIVIVLALILVGLFLSMMRQMRKIKVPRAGAEAGDEGAGTPADAQQDEATEDPEEPGSEQDRSRRQDSTT
ncbi:hypothetical protein [Microlunatus speluncae]|uniref:hypothetical protein n=1 Tax=Microlunatus speluncae TaxID=2594267 RepID=UPI00126636FE|nr:hypothetical protein [Microlunatus speluncae]